MNMDETVSKQKERDAAMQRDLAPVSPVRSAAASMDEVNIFKPTATAEKFDVNRKRDKEGKPVRDFISIGERIHNEITYRGVDWLLNSAAGVAFTVWTHRTETGRKYFTEPVEGFFKKILSPIFKKEESLNKGVHWGVNFLSIMFGGTITIPPVMYLENPKHKRPIVTFLDKLIYGKDKVKNDPKFEKAYDEIDVQPKKDFWTGLGTRFISLAPLIALTVIIPTHNFIEKNFYNHISRGTKYVAEKIGINKNRGFLGEIHAHGSDGHAVSNWDYIHKIIGFDFGLTIFYSVLHEISYKFFAKKEDDQRQRKVAKETHTLEKIIEKPSEPTLAEAVSKEHPGPRISNATHMAALNAEQQLSAPQLN